MALTKCFNLLSYRLTNVVGPKALLFKMRCGHSTQVKA